ncbi:MAG: hypothetical protein QM723_30830 [Myxococcaceae bacterium]
MNVDSLRKALPQIKTPADVDKLMVQVRDAGGLDPTEKAELVRAADGFDDATKQRLLTHLSSLGQTNAWVNIDAGSTRVTDIQGRYASLKLDIPGLKGREGLFDSTFALTGKALKDGTLKLNIEGKDVQVPVKKGESASTVLGHLQKQLPQGVSGLVYGGDVKPFDPESFNGISPTTGQTAAHITLFKPDALGLKPGEKPLRVVVTGYGAFMGITDNPSANMAQKLSEMGVKGGVVQYQRLDVTEGAVDDFIKSMKKNPPDVILSMGVAPDSQVEEQPENKVSASTDGNNQPMKDGPVVKGQAAGKVLHTDLPVQVIDNALKPFGDKREVGTSLSNPNYTPDRSAYLCNYLGYNLANTFGKTPATTGGFVHVTDHTPPDQMHALLEAVVANQLDYRRTANQPKPAS